MSKNFCMKCKKEVDESTTACRCGCQAFVYGDKFHLEGKYVVCYCGSKVFKNTTHLDFTNKAITSYVCSKCGNSVGVEVYRNLE